MRNACVTDDPPLLCVVPYAEPDAQQAWDLLNWMHELGGCKRNPCLLVASSKIDADSNSEILTMAAAVFRSVQLITTPGELPDERWPMGPNWMFQTAMNWVYQHAKVPFWWNEPDCIPLRSGWLELLESEYYMAGKPFMGAVVKGVTVGATVIPDSVNGCAVYPADTAVRFGKIQFGGPEAWDILAGPITAPCAHHSKHYQYFWGEPNLAPTFAQAHTKGEPRNTFTLEQIRADSVVFHRNKDGTLIQELRRRRDETPRIVHVVERHFPTDTRTQRAVDSWAQIQSDTCRTIEVWKYPRSSKDIGDERALPYVKDLLAIGMDAAGTNDIVTLTNGDNLLHPTLPDALRIVMNDVPAICSFRLNVTGTPNLRLPIGSLIKTGKPDFGRDLFAFRKWWLEKHWNNIPDMLLGEWEWDLIMVLMIRRFNGVVVSKKDELNYGNPRSELPLGYVLHEMHERKWMSPAMLASKGKWHNAAKAKEWYAKNGLMQFYTLI